MKKNIRLFAILLSMAFFQMPTYGDFNKGLAAYKNKDYSTALKEFQKDAEKGNPKAQFHLGLMYRNGKGVTKNIVLAYALYNISAVQGHDIPKKARDNLEPKLTPKQLEEAESISEAWKINTPFPTTTKY